MRQKADARSQTSSAEDNYRATQRAPQSVTDLSGIGGEDRRQGNNLENTLTMGCSCAIPKDGGCKDREDECANGRMVVCSHGGVLGIRTNVISDFKSLIFW